MSCGAALEHACPSCGTPAPDGARFCMSCGTQLGDVAAAPGPSAPSSPPAPSPPGSEPAASVDEELGLDERRTATVLFADLSGYTAIAETLDPEAVKRLLARILARL